MQLTSFLEETMNYETLETEARQTQETRHKEISAALRDMMNNGDPYMKGSIIHLATLMVENDKAVAKFMNDLYKAEDRFTKSMEISLDYYTAQENKRPW